MKIRSISDMMVFRILRQEIETALKKSKQDEEKEEQSSSMSVKFLDDAEILPIILKFVDTFKHNFTEQQTKHMLYKLKSLMIQFEKDKSLLGNSLGNYNSKRNVITITCSNKQNREETFCHELLHMASTVQKGDYQYVGFDILEIIGRKLNECYTEYLTRKYFTRGNEYVKTGDIDIIIAKGIENIIGAEKMQEYYFNGDLYSLIEDLSVYSSKDSIIKLLFLMDQLYCKLKTSREIDEIIKEIALLNKQKLTQEYEKGMITRTEYEIQYNIKVRHYRCRNLWSEATKVVGNGEYYYLEDQGFKSKIYKV